jgi:hypothetical protein
MPGSSSSLARKFGLEYGLFYYDENVKDEPPAVYSIQGNRASLQLDFEKALSVSERQGWGQVQFVFKLKDGETWDFSLYIGPPGTYLAVPNEGQAEREGGSPNSGSLYDARG